MAIFGADLRLASRDYDARLRRYAMRVQIRVDSDVDLGVGRQRHCNVQVPGGVELTQVETIIPGGVFASVRPVRPEAYALTLANALVWGVPLASYRDTEGPGGADYGDLTCLWHRSGDADLAARTVLDHLDRGFRGAALTLDDLMEGARPVIYRRLG